MTNQDGKSSRELEREIEETRARFDERAQLLQEQLSPGELFETALERLRSSGAKNFFQNLGRTVRDNPVPVLLTGAGIVWLAASSPSEVDEDEELDDPFNGSFDSSSTGRRERMRRRLSSAGSRVKGKASRAGSRISSGMSSAKEGASSAKDSVSGGIRRGRHRAMRGASRLQEGWDRTMDEQPLLMGLLGIAAGALLGATLPSTRMEDEWLGEERDDFLAAGARKAREGAEDMREKAEEAADSASQSSQKSPSGKSPSGNSTSAGSTSSPSPSIAAASKSPASTNDIGRKTY